MSINDLIELMPPPEEPAETEGDWSVPEKEFGIQFPADFKELIRVYGTGEFLHGLMIANPLTERGRKEIKDWLWTYGEIRDACEIPLVLHPERPGLLPWGSDSDANGYCWQTTGEPDQWPIVQLGHGYEDEPLQADVGITEFLVRFATNEYEEMLGGVRFEPESRTFRKGRPGD